MRHKPEGTKPGHTQPDHKKPEVAGGIELPVMVVYAAMLMACEPGGDAAGLGASLRAALVERRLASPTGRMLRDMMGSGMPGAVMPFSRSALDRAYACAMADSGEGFSFFTEGAEVEAGYFQVNSLRVDYVDRVGKGWRASELLAAPALRRLLKLLRGAEREPLFIEVPDDDAVALRIVGCDWLRAQAGPLRLSLLRPGLSRPGLPARRLGPASLAPGPSGLALTGMRVEHLMELQAASIQGSWLLVEGSLRCLAPLPDLTEAGARSPAWLCPVDALSEGLGGAVKVSMPIDPALAQRLMQRFAWAAAADPADWLAACATALTHPLELTEPATL